MKSLAKSRILFGVLVLSAGCASYDGRGLVPGQSRAADVEASMGAPTERIQAAGGESLWFYARGIQSYAVRIGSDGVLRGIDQRLTIENVRKLYAGGTTTREVRELLGPPYRVSTGGRLGGEVWDYRMYDDTQHEQNVSVLFSSDGVVRQVYVLREVVNEPMGM